jgi:hypothetical protein
MQQCHTVNRDFVVSTVAFPLGPDKALIAEHTQMLLCAGPASTNPIRKGLAGEGTVSSKHG